GEVFSEISTLSLAKGRDPYPRSIRQAFTEACSVRYFGDHMDPSLRFGISERDLNPFSADLISSTCRLLCRSFHHVLIHQDHHQGGGGYGDQRAQDSGERSAKRKSNDHRQRRELQGMFHDARGEKDALKLEIDGKKDKHTYQLLRGIEERHD